MRSDNIAKYEFRRVMGTEIAPRPDAYGFLFLVSLMTVAILQAAMTGVSSTTPQPTYSMQEVLEQKRLTKEKYEPHPWSLVLSNEDYDRMNAIMERAIDKKNRMVLR